MRTYTTNALFDSEKTSPLAPCPVLLASDKDSLHRHTKRNDDLFIFDDQTGQTAADKAAASTSQAEDKLQQGQELVMFPGVNAPAPPGADARMWVSSLPDLHLQRVGVSEMLRAVHHAVVIYASPWIAHRMLHHMALLACLPVFLDTESAFPVADFFLILPSARCCVITSCWGHYATGACQLSEHAGLQHMQQVPSCFKQNTQMLKLP